MDQFTRKDLNSLIAERPAPCVSVFAPTHRGGNAADPIVWRNQLDEAESRLNELGRGRDGASELLRNARKLLEQPEFWKNTGDGLALFVAPDFFQIYRLPFTLEKQVVVGAHFQVTPLLPWIADEGHFHVLALSQNRVRLYEGDAHGLHEVAAPANMKETRKTHDRDEILNLHSHPGKAGTAMQAVFHGHGVGIDDHKDELLHYFQVVDHAVLAHTGDRQSPLVLATVEYLAPLYRKASKHPHLLEAVIHGNPDHLSAAQLHAKALSLVEPEIHGQRDRALARFRQAVGTGRTSNDIATLLSAAARGELETVLFVNGHSVWGRLDNVLNQVEAHAKREAKDEDLVNLTVVDMLRHRRQVFAVAADPMFDRSSIVGVYFLPLPHHGK
jgi:Bacterial archaeo-eukaryotic release factor family 3